MAKVMIVEDDQITQDILKVIMYQEKHETISASNGMEAIQLLESTPVDLVITDIRMPVMDGLELLDRMRKDRRFENIPVIVLTASLLRDSSKITSEFGATRFLSQPFSSWDIKKAVAECIAAPEKQE